MARAARAEGGKVSKFISDDCRTLIHELLEKGYDKEQIAVAIAAEVFDYIDNLEPESTPKGEHE